MGRLDQKEDNVKDLFYNFPSREFQVREISRLSFVPKTTVQRILGDLIKEKMVVAKKGNVFRSYLADNTSFWYLFFKRNDLVEHIYSSGLVTFLEDIFHPKTIILFGSGAKGEYVKESDIDLFLLAGEKNIDLSKFEKKLKRKINVIFKESYSDLNAELFNNIINGVKLSGYIKLR